MIEIQQKLLELILTTTHISFIKIRANNKKLNCNKFVSKKDSDYFFTGVYMCAVRKAKCNAFLSFIKLFVFQMRVRFLFQEKLLISISWYMSHLAYSRCYPKEITKINSFFYNGLEKWTLGNRFIISKNKPVSIHFVSKKTHGSCFEIGQRTFPICERSQIPWFHLGHEAFISTSY